VAFPGLPTIALVLLAQVAPPEAPDLAAAKSPAQVREAFLKLLDRPRVPLDVRAGPAVLDEKSGLTTERLTFASERKADGTTERVPVLVVRPSRAGGRRPAVIALHGTGGNKDGMRGWLDDLAKRGIIGVAIDARYHGDRSGGKHGSAAYVAEITRAWRAKPGEPSEHPLYYDTCWDIWRTLDYLETRPDVDPKRVGMVGISMGGIETWLAASVDRRVAVAVPAISVQSFRWGLEHDAWHARANTFKAASDAAATDLGQQRVNARVCRELWDKVIPGILGPFDCPSMIRLFAGRPLLILNGKRDIICPIEGARVAYSAAERAYKAADASDKLRIIVASNVGHTVTRRQHAAALDWLTEWLKP
jgi:pimeloyl-ACP methyl ester carboxylesterase